MDLETLYLETADAVSPLQALQTRPTRKPNAKAAREAEGRPALQQQDSSGSWAIQQEVLLSQIKRGEECLDQIRQELAAVRADLEEWPAYEQICGQNPLADYLQAIAAKEQIIKFLPGWLKRQRDQLQSLNQKRAAGGKR